jgi:hypothetical protein
MAIDRTAQAVWYCLHQHRFRYRPKQSQAERPVAISTWTILESALGTSGPTTGVLLALADRMQALF